ncbi:hypothetical protein AMTR_s00024p00241030 [Amborella trichopoda]|uniref:Uncharacterized protein n=1 Tax=Amborella trichopoda TaxID=13333 RepID=W1PVH2_AMBTC|nr:hypothetical protein AMTR_s00024p00241030 [Amborella trichopoda]
MVRWLGICPMALIRSKRAKASSARPECTNPLIIVFQATTLRSLSSIPSKTFHALTISPFFAYKYTRAVRETSPSQSFRENTNLHFSESSIESLAQAESTLTIVSFDGFTPLSLISTNTLRAS